MKTITIRPGLVPYTLSGAIAVTIGSAFLKQGMDVLAIVCWLMLLPIVLLAALDRIEFNGKTIKHCGPLAYILGKVFRMHRELAIADVESITTETLRLSFATEIKPDIKVWAFSRQ